MPWREGHRKWMVLLSCSGVMDPSLEMRQSHPVWVSACRDTWHSLGSHRDQLVIFTLVPHTLLLKAWTGAMVGHQKEQGKCVQESNCFCHWDFAWEMGEVEGKSSYVLRLAEGIWSRKEMTCVVQGSKRRHCSCTWSSSEKFSSVLYRAPQPDEGELGGLPALWFIWTTSLGWQAHCCLCPKLTLFEIPHVAIMVTGLSHPGP